MIDTLFLRVKSLEFFHIAIVFILFAFLVLLSNGMVCAKEDEQASIGKEINLVWSANHGQGEQVFFSSYKQKNWTIPVQVSDSDEFVFQPVSCVGDDGKIWVVWTDMQNEKALLQFSVYQSSSWTEPRQINTGMDDNRAATLVVDVNNTPWLAWTAADESYSDVFWSRWNGTRWESPVKAHSNNNVPDTQPALITDESGQVVLSWQTYVDGKYSMVSQRWDGQQWQKLPSVSEQKIRVERKRITAELPEIPEFIKERHKAKIFIKDDVGAGAIPLSQF